MKHTGPHYVYIIACSDGTLYTGYTNDLGHRLEAHNSGRGAKYLRGRTPVTLVYSRKFRQYRSALRAEHAIKRLTRSQKNDLIRAASRTNGRSS